MEKVNSTTFDIIISAYDYKRFKDIAESLKRLEEQSDKEFSVFVIIDSDEKLYDDLKKYIEESRFSFTSKIIFNNTNKGLSFSRNLGLKHSNGDIIAFIDDDAIPHKKWIEKIKKYSSDDSIGAITGEVKPKWMYKKPIWFPDELYWMLSCSYTETPNKIQEVRNGFGTNMAFKRKYLEEIGGFNISLGLNATKNIWIGGEDTEIFLKIKKNLRKKVLFDPDIIVEHKIYADRLTLKKVIKRLFGAGYSISKTNLTDENEQTEYTYLNSLIFNFIPRKIFSLFKQGKIDCLIQSFVLISTILLIGLGFIFEKINFKF